MKIASAPLLAAILALALLPRLAGLPEEILSYDEQAAWRFGQGSFLQLLQGIAAKDCHPPLFYLLQWASESIFGPGGIGSRLPVLLTSLAMIPAVFVFGREWSGRDAGLLAALLLAIHPWAIHLSRDLRMYSLLFLLVTLFYATLPALCRGSRRALHGAILLATLILLTHYLAFVYLLAALAVLCLPGAEAGRELLRRYRVRSFLWPLGILFLWLSFALVSLYQQGHFPLTWGIVHPTWEELPDLLAHADWCEQDSSFRSMVFLVVSPLILLFPAFRQKKSVALLLLVWLPVLLHYVISLLSRDFFGAGTLQMPHLFPVLAVVLLLIARAFLHVRSPFLLLVIGAALLLRPLDLLHQQLQWRELNPWPQVLSALRDLPGTMPVLLVSPPASLADLAEEDLRGVTLSACETAHLPATTQRWLTLGADPLFAVSVQDLHSTAGLPARHSRLFAEEWQAATVEIFARRQLRVQIIRPREEDMIWQDSRLGLQRTLEAGETLELGKGEPERRKSALPDGSTMFFHLAALLWFLSFFAQGDFGKRQNLSDGFSK